MTGGGGGGGRVTKLKVPNFSNIIPWDALIHKKLYCCVCQFTKNYTAGYAIFIHKGLHSKITGTACVSMLAIKINCNLGSAF